MRYSPFIRISCWICVRALSPIKLIQMIWNFTWGFVIIRGCVVHKGHNSRLFTFWVISPCLKFHVKSVSGQYFLFYWSNGFETSHVDLLWWEGVSWARVLTLKSALFELFPFDHRQLNLCPLYDNMAFCWVFLELVPQFFFWGEQCVYTVFHVRPMPLNSRVCCPQTALVGLAVCCNWTKNSN